MGHLLRVENLSVSYSSAGQSVHAVRHASFSIGAGEVVGILGESGSGKSTLALSFTRMLPANARCETGTVIFGGRNLLQLTEKQLATVRGAEIAIIWQDPALALNPVMRVGQQIAEVLRAHGCGDRPQRKERVRELLAEVGFEQPAEVARAYPHQLSGGQRQRVGIAQALCCRPALVIADEPTSKLDAALQVEILALLSELRNRHRMACLIISHDPAVFAGWADRMLVMYAGEIVEEGTSEQVFGRPLHPYSQALVGLSEPALAAPRRHLPVIAGEPPDMNRLPAGCSFEPRCAERMKVCAGSSPGQSTPEANRQVSCFKYE
ncbi:MAG TPA: ABC transporter ATP-binding protein [Terriglobales bacterium]|nr:ABC transporter ATP-binding protein [Terriglobales bacterium]